MRMEAVRDKPAPPPPVTQYVLYLSPQEVNDIQDGLAWAGMGGKYGPARQEYMAKYRTLAEDVRRIRDAAYEASLPRR